MTLRYRILRLVGYKTLSEYLLEMQSGKGGGIGPKERRKLKLLERASFPLFIKYPKSGEIYSARFDVEIKSTIQFMAPFTDSKRVMIPKGTKVIILEANDPNPVTIYFRPVDVKMEMLIVAEDHRKNPSYDGYGLSADTIDFKNKFQKSTD